MKPGRNDPCPCDSGRKYKQCCLAAVGSVADERASTRAMVRAHRWLSERFRGQLQDLMTYDLFAGLGDPVEIAEALDDCDQDVQEAVETFTFDWFLCEFEFERHDHERRALDWVLDRRGPRLDPAERAWLEALRPAPLRLYEVSAVRPGEGLTLRDVIEPARGALQVEERLGSRSLEVGDSFAARLVEWDGHLEIATGVFPLDPSDAAKAFAQIQAELASMRFPPDDVEAAAVIVSDTLRAIYLEAMLFPRPPPQIVQRTSGEPVLLVEDDYAVTDPAAFAARLAAEPDVVFHAGFGWSRLQDPEAEFTRSLSAVNLGETSDRVTLFHSTASAAEAGREWFLRAVGDLVEHLERREVDPMRALMEAPGDQAQRVRSAPAQRELPPDVLAEVIDKVTRRHYANWCDEPIPLLDDRTPRDMVRNREGRERVRQLLRHYEASEARAAVADGRRPLDFDFLWHGLGLSREEGT
jgi:hypothetical protein